MAIKSYLYESVLAVKLEKTTLLIYGKRFSRLFGYFVSAALQL